MIRRWQTSDTMAVAEIEAQSFSDPWTEQMLSDALSNPAFIGFVKEQDGAVCGYIGLIVCVDAEVALIAVSPKHRRCGVGEELLRYALQFVGARGVDAVFLEVRASNTPAKGLYKKLGFLPVGERRGYYSDGEDAIVMAVNLTQEEK